MSAFFFDTSAFVKRYVEETGSRWIRDLARPSVGNRIYLAWIAAPEIASALTRRWRSGELSNELFTATMAQFRFEWDGQYRRLDVTRAILRHAVDLVERHGLRGYDAVQLASALEAAVAESTAQRDLTFVSADTALNAAAEAEGLTVANPFDHP